MILTSIIFIAFGILIKYGKMYYLIAGYNTMSVEKKAEFNIERIATLFRNVFFGMAIAITMGYYISKWLENSMIENISFFGAILVGIPYLLIKSNYKTYKLKE
ncbi:MAG: DUF3784 domain-containing protein [Flavobacteriaceae bacterium]|nr:DUF3784 domain-containing protein [Flavobacteriaceae bacterium]